MPPTLLEWLGSLLVSGFWFLIIFGSVFCLFVVGLTEAKKKISEQMMKDISMLY